MTVKRHFDIFPALLRIAPPGTIADSQITEFQTRGDAPEGTRRLDRCRVIHMGETLMVAVDSPEGPKLVFQEKLDHYWKEKKTYWVKTFTGKVIVIEKDNNCGCGSRLRSWNPYRSQSVFPE